MKRRRFKARESLRGHPEDITAVVEALHGTRGDDQGRIAEVGIRWLATLLRKNADYGSSAWKAPILAPECDVAAAIRVRMGDKVERIRSLLSKGGAEVASESLEDTVGDLGSYCLLLLARPKAKP